MSFISIVARKNFVTVMSDGQVTGYNNTPLQEEQKKFKVISEKQFIAFAGFKEPCEFVVNQIDYTDNFYDLESIAEQIFYMINQKELENIRLFFAIGGLDSIKNEIVFYTVDNAGMFDIYKALNDRDFKYIFFNPINEVNLEHKFNQFLTVTGNDNADSCLKSQKMLNDYVAEIDAYVNKQTFELKIEI